MKTNLQKFETLGTYGVVLGDAPYIANESYDGYEVEICLKVKLLDGSVVYVGNGNILDEACVGVSNEVIYPTQNWLPKRGRHSWSHNKRAKKVSYEVDINELPF